MVNEVILSNDEISCGIIPKDGGVVSFLKDNRTNQNIIKPMDPIEGWPNGGIPFLFPFAGRCWADGNVNHYVWGQILYEMPIHGFMWNREFKVISKQENKLILSYHSNDKDLEYYPFAFELVLEYFILNTSLSTKVTVKNNSSEILPLAPGFHPYFTTQFLGENLTLPSVDCFQVTSSGNLGDPITLDLSEKVSSKNTTVQNLIVSNYQHNLFSLNTKDLSIQISPDEKFSYFVLWAKEEEKFFCIEPWFGTPDAVHNKKGLTLINPSKTFSFSYSITISHPDHSN